MPDTTFAPGSTIRSDWLNEVNDAIFKNTNPAGNPSGAATLRSDLASGAAAKGSDLVYFDSALAYAANTAGWGIKTATNLVNVLRYVPPAEWSAILDGTSATDLTSYLQTAIAAETGLFFPAGRWNVSATTGLTLKDGLAIKGAGKNRTMFWAISGTGASAAELAAYNKGAVFRRQFSLGVANANLSGVVLEDFGIILNHPTASITTTAIQVGIDLRNISRAHVSRVHIGNYAPGGSFVSKSDPPSGYAQQGYGIILGNVPSGGVDYCGGEVHTISETAVWGAFKLIVQDDAALSPNSAAHAVNVISCDLQGGHHGLVQESQYATGCAWIGNTIQNTIKQNGNASTSYVERFSGYGSFRRGGYLETGSGADFICRLESASATNDFSYSYYSAANAAAFSDLGSRNKLEYRVNTGAIPGGVDSLGAPIVLVNRAPLQCFWKGFWNGASFTVVASSGMTLTRNGVGDYSIALTTAQPNANWVASILLDTNASGHGGTLAFDNGTQSTSALRFFTYAQNGGTTTIIDPRMLLITVGQMPS